MPIKLLSISEQYDLLSKLDNEEKEYDKNLTLAKGDLYALKHKHNMDLEPSPADVIKQTFKQQPTIAAIKNIPRYEKPIKKENLDDSLLLVPKLEPVDENELHAPTPVNDENNLADDVDLAVIQKHGFPIPEMILSQKMEMSEIIESIGKYIKTKVAPALSNLSRIGKKDTNQYAEIKNEQVMLSQYKTNLEAYLQELEDSKQEGTGVKAKHASVYFTNMADMQQRFLEILGEIKAGNNNDMLKNELVGIMDIMLQKGKLGKREYKKMFQFLKI